MFIPKIVLMVVLFLTLTQELAKATQERKGLLWVRDFVPVLWKLMARVKLSCGVKNRRLLAYFWGLQDGEKGQEMWL